MMKRTRGEEAKSSRETIEAANAYDAASGLGPAAVDGPGQDPESDLKRAIRKAPDNPDNYVRLGDLYTKGGKLKQAVAAFRQAAELNNDPAIVERAEDAELAEMRQQVDQAKAKARELKDEKRMARAREAEARMNDRHIAVPPRTHGAARQEHAAQVRPRPAAARQKGGAGGDPPVAAGPPATRASRSAPASPWARRSSWTTNARWPSGSSRRP